MPVDRCDECHFDGSRWTDQDVLTTLRVARELWAGHLEGADDRVLRTRPDASTWSIAEYTHHLPDTLWAMRFLTEVTRESPGRDLGQVEAPAFDGEAAEVDVDAELQRMADEAFALGDALSAVPTEEWSRSTVVLSGDEVDLGWIGRHALHDLTHHLHDISRIRVALGDGVAHQVGSVSHLAASGGGVPKARVEQFEVGWSGADGDRQADRRHHGRPFQALCLWSGDVIDALRGEGHPIEPGLAGENITVVGVDWSSLRPGTIVRIGTAMGEISSHATPCAKNAGWFHDREFRRIDHDEHPGWSRLYATVLEPGAVAVGDAFVVEPARTNGE
jgi:MOSC domain-containing protein YiiM